MCYSYQQLVFIINEEFLIKIFQIAYFSSMLFTGFIYMFLLIFPKQRTLLVCLSYCLSTCVQSEYLIRLYILVKPIVYIRKLHI